MTAGLLLAAAIAAAPPAKPAPGEGRPIPAARVMTHRVIGVSVDLTLSPVSRMVQGKAKLRLKPREAQSQAAGLAVLQLDRAFAVARVTLDDRPAKFQVEGARLVVPLPRPSRPGAGWVVGVDYAGRLTDADAVLKLGPTGAVLPNGNAAWFPVLDAGAPKVPTIVTVRAPKAWRVVGPAARTTVDPPHQAVRLDFAGGDPAIVAGPYKVFSAAGNTFYALTAPPADAGSARAVEAFYRAHGLQLGAAGRTGGTATAGTLVELPAGSMPIVGENWSAGARPPGGLGAWLATRAWRHRDLNFATGRQTWLVDSLAAYTEELALGAEPQIARTRAIHDHLAGYQGFLRRQPGKDRPLSAVTPADEAWRPVVGDKGVILWNLVRESLGDDAFWALLRRHQAALRAGTGDPQAFKAAAGPRVDWLEDWLTGTALPSVRLADVKITAQEGRWQVTGALAQDAGFARFPIDLALVTEAGVEKIAFTTFAPRVPFHFVASARPLRLVLDGADRAPVVRRPHLAIPEGVAPADGVIVYGTQGDPLDNQASREAAEALRDRLKRYKDLDLPLRADRELTDAERGRSLILMGRPGVNGVAADLADQFPVRFARGEATAAGGEAVVDGKALWWQGRTYAEPGHGVVQVIANPHAPDRVVVLFAGLSPRAQADALRFTQRQATYCVFAGDRVVAEGDALRPFPDLDVVLY